jgi:hypothetical protein
MTEQPAFRERLLPRWWVVAIINALVAMVAVAYGAAFGTGLGVAIFIGAALLVCVLLYISAPVISVTGQELVAGRARLPRTSIVSARALNGDEARTARGPQADARTYVLLRAWRSSKAVLVQIQDPADPHPAWLLTSRDPEALVSALQ